ncbi:MAG: sigma factor-like helix-turn-helix DNA-binding protein [Metamycoplasmataceae bacterium]
MNNSLEREELIRAFLDYDFILTQNQKQIMHLHYIEDLSMAEIAEIVATTRSAVFDALDKARKKLKPFINSK